MLWGNRGRNTGRKPGRRHQSFRPGNEALEDRKLLTAIDLSTTQTAGLGVEEVGPAAGAGAGLTTTDVGDVSGDGYDDFIVAATGITAPNGAPSSATTASAAYLVFGSKAVNSTTAVDFLTLTNTATAPQRAGDLATLGQLNQVNPTFAQPAAPAATVPGFNYDGLKFITTQNGTTGVGSNSALGYSVAALGDINGDGFDDFALGAPNDAGGGRAFVVFGGSALASQPVTGKIIDLEPTAGTTSSSTPTKVVSFSLAGAGAGTNVGYAVAGIGNYLNFGTNVKDVGIGAPGVNNNTGAAYALSGTAISLLGAGTNVNLATVGSSGGIGITYTGTAAGSLAGAALATAGDFDAALSGTLTIDSLLIGAPGTAAGTTYLVYGNQAVPATNKTLGTTLSLATLGTTATTTVTAPLQGIVFNGISAGARLGFAVASAGDYNGDGTGDIIIGAPGSGTTTSGSAANGFAAIVYGVPQNTTSTRVNGIVSIDPNAATTGLTTLYYVGEGTGDLAGYSVSPVGDISGVGVNGVLIGAPGFGGGLGAAYVIPGNYALTGTQSLSNVNSATIAGSRLTTTQSFPGSTPFLGASVSGRPLFGIAQARTLDSDTVPDVIVGAPGFSLTDPTNLSAASRTTSGIAYALSGSLLGIGVPNNVITTQVGVGVNTPTGPYTIATTPNNLTIYIYSAPATGTLPAFAPFTDIDQTSIVINGVPFPTLANFTSVADTNGDGVPEASFVIDRSLLNLVAGTTITFTVRGTTNAGTVFVASAQVSVTGGTTGGGTIVTTPVGLDASFALVPPTFSGENAGLPYPPISSLEHKVSYAPLPVTIAYQQFLPAPGFLAREEVAHHPSKKNNQHQQARGTVLYVQGFGARGEPKVLKQNFYPHKSLSRTKFHIGKVTTFTHGQKVIPRSQQRGIFQG